MSINVKKYTKDQMAKMAEDAQAEVQELKRVNAAMTEQIEQMNGEAINKANEIANLKADADALRNKLADTEASLGRANEELTRSTIENKQMWDERVKLVNRAAVECARADYAELHPWPNLWAWVKRKLGCA